MTRQMKHTFSFVLLVLVCYLLQVGSSYANVTKLPILGFHHIALDSYADKNYPNNMWVAKLSDFEEQMRYLYEHDYRTLRLDEVYAWKKGKLDIDDKCVVLTFDDGFLSTIHYVEPILKKYGFTASVFVIGSQIENHGAYDDTRRQHASLQDMKESTLSFYSHTYQLHHKEHGFAVDQASIEEIRSDLQESNQWVSSEYVAYPYGRYNDKIKQVLKENHTKLAFGYHENKKADRNDNDYQLPRFSVNRYTSMAAFQAMLKE